ncbi:MAG: hypothetical protein SFZ03_00325 [Candidatus Melainabacteria bacterium]|nr:hypothetical protein [Candidatus Melainabacteria bacterium]
MVDNLAQATVTRGRVRIPTSDIATVILDIARMTPNEANTLTRDTLEAYALRLTAEKKRLRHRQSMNTLFQNLMKDSSKNIPGASMFMQRMFTQNAQSEDRQDQIDRRLAAATTLYQHFDSVAAASGCIFNLTDDDPHTIVQADIDATVSRDGDDSQLSAVDLAVTEELVVSFQHPPEADVMPAVTETDDLVSDTTTEEPPREMPQTIAWQLFVEQLATTQRHHSGVGAFEPEWTTERALVSQNQTF